MMKPTLNHRDALIRLALVVSFCLALMLSVSPAGAYEQHVNCGSPDGYVATGGTEYQPDRAYTSGDWSRAFDLLAGLPVADRAKEFIMNAIALQQYSPPPDWGGVYEMSHK